MPALRRKLTFIVFAVAWSLAPGCSSPNLLLKSSENVDIKKIALVNVYSNREARNFTGDVKKNKFLGSRKASKEEEKNEEKPNVAQLPRFAQAVFNAEFAKIPGLEVMATENVVDTTPYQNFINDIKGMAGNAASAKLGEIAYVTAGKMTYIPDGGRTPSTRQALAKLAQAINVDAVAVLELDIAYMTHRASGKSGTAAAFVGTSLILVHRNGGYAVSMPPVILAKSESDFRLRSDGTTTMLEGEIVYDTDTEQLFQNSIHKGVSAIKQEIELELRGK